ncbi:MAG: ABC transporter substrate-binding protein [Phycisphaerales bacterium]|nr:ABC transporter substrate-binding protein [Phycisphaerales bacterium]
MPANRFLRLSSLLFAILILTTVGLTTVRGAPYVPVAASEEPTPRAEVLVGMSTALSGPAADLGLGMRAGVEAAFAAYNRRTDKPAKVALTLKALDDGYEPSRAAPNVRELIETHHVAAILGNVGTPTAVVSIPIASESKIPFIGAFTGARVLRPTPPNRYVINYRASYAEECAAMVDALVAHAGLKPEDIALFTQRDAYGDDGYNSAMMAMKRHGLEDENAIIHGRYERNSVAVEHALADMISSGDPPKAVIMVGTAIASAKFIRLAREYGLETRFLSVSFVGTAKLASELGDIGDGVVVTQVVPHYDADLPIVKEFHASLPADAAFHKDFCALEGFVAAKMFLHAVDRIPGAVTPESIVQAMEGLGEHDIGLGEPLVLSAERHQASMRVWPTVLRGGSPQPMKWEELKAQP